MKTHTLKVTIPSEQEIVSGLSLHTLHPKLTAAEEKHADAVRRLEAERSELEQRERDVDGLPARIASGRAAPADLERAILQRDAAALRLGPLELAEAEALDRVQIETERAEQARRARIQERVEILKRAAAEVTPLLDALRELESALGIAADKNAWGVLGHSVEWPKPLADEVAEMNLQMSLKPSPFKSVTIDGAVTHYERR